MDGQRVDALVLGDPRDLDGVQHALVPPAADLGRQRDRDRLAHGAKDHRRPPRIAHERRPLALGHDLRHRAAHVEVDRVGARRLQPPRRLREHVGIGAQQLHGERPLLGQVARDLAGVGVVLDEGAGVDLLAGEEPRAALARDEPEGDVGYARHGREPKFDGRRFAHERSVYQGDRTDRAAVGALQLEGQRQEAAALDADLVQVRQVLDHGDAGGKEPVVRRALLA